MQLVEHDVAQVLEEALRASAMAISSASCSGVVSRMSGGIELLALALVRRACRRCGVSSAHRQAASRRPACSRLRSMSTASALSGEM